MIMHEIKIRRAFTITELIVAVGLLAAVLAASTIIFHYSLESQRTAMATAEIMRNLRAITDQLNSDFAGFRRNDALMIIGYNFGGDGSRADSLVFFAAGDFQDANGTVRGNVARIYYGEANEPDPLSDSRNKILVRKQVILAPAESNSTEHEPYGLSQQVNYSLNYLADANEKWMTRPAIDINEQSQIPMYLAKGVDNFSIMFDADVNSTTNSINWWPQTGESTNINNYYNLKSSGYPDLIKFTFTLYDSKGILKTGRTFEHIVYIGK